MTRTIAILLSILALSACESGGLYASTSGESYASTSY